MEGPLSRALVFLHFTWYLFSLSGSARDSCSLIPGLQSNTACAKSLTDGKKQKLRRAASYVYFIGWYLPRVRIICDPQQRDIEVVFEWMNTTVATLDISSYLTRTKGDERCTTSVLQNLPQWLEVFSVYTHSLVFPVSFYCSWSYSSLSVCAPEYSFIFLLIKSSTVDQLLCFDPWVDLISSLPSLISVEISLSCLLLCYDKHRYLWKTEKALAQDCIRLQECQEPPVSWERSVEERAPWNRIERPGSHPVSFTTQS